MKKKILWIGAPIVVVGLAFGAMGMRGGGQEALEVQTAKVIAKRSSRK